MSKKELDHLYRSGEADAWSSSVQIRPDWKLVQALLKQLPGRLSVLDVGCFNGAMLASLEGEHERFGIEIHPYASQIAASNGIRILGTDFATIQTGTAFDVITAIDVIEHTHDPFAFLSELVSHLRPGGYVVVSSGNADHMTFRLMGSRYWYCAIPEHLSFVGPAWSEWAAKTLGLNVTSVHTFSHIGEASLIKQLREVAANLVYRFNPALFRSLRRNGFGRVRTQAQPELDAYPPAWMTSHDHFLVVFQRP